MVAFAEGAAAFTGVSGKALIAFVGGANVLTVGAGIGLADVMYGAYRMGKCLEQKHKDGPTCELTRDLEDYCTEVLKENSGYSESSKASCKAMLFNLMQKKLSGTEIRIWGDTVRVMTAPRYKPNRIKTSAYYIIQQ